MGLMILSRIRYCMVPVAIRQMLVAAIASVALLLLLTLPVRAEKAASADGRALAARVTHTLKNGLNAACRDGTG